MEDMLAELPISIILPAVQHGKPAAIQLGVGFSLL